MDEKLQMPGPAGGQIEANRMQVPPKRDVSGSKFVAGIIDYDFSIGGRYVWRPAKSYFRVDMTLYKRNASVRAQPVVADGLAFSDNPVAGLFDNVYLRGGNADISSIVNFAGQAHQLKTRATKSRAWMESVGKTAFGINASFQDRVNAVSSDGLSSEENIGSAPTVLRQTIVVGGTVAIADAAGDGNAVATGGSFAGAQVGDLLSVAGQTYAITSVAGLPGTVSIGAGTAPGNIGATPGATVIPVNALAAGQPSDRANNVRYMWQPPIGIFDFDGVLGSGEYRIQLNPNSRFQQSVVETSAALNPGDANGYDVVVNEIQFYPWIEKANVPVTGVERLFLNEMNIQSKTFTNTGVLDWTVPPSTQQLAVFVQSDAAGSDSRFPQTLFRTETAADGDVKLENIQITYANKTMPSTNWESSYGVGTNLMTQRYLDTQIETGMVEASGGAETFADFKSRGPIYVFDFSRDASDRSTNVQLQMKFTGALTNARIMLASFYNRVVEITTSDGRISNIQSLSV
jgi:hypothetical protein